MPAKPVIRQYYLSMVVLIAVLLSAFSWVSESGVETRSMQGGDSGFSDINPTYEWVRFIGTEKVDALSEVREDGGGNIYILYDAFVVDEEEHANQFQIFLTKLTPNGNAIWEIELEMEPGSYSDSIVVDALGDIYISGSSEKTWGNPVNPFYATTEDQLYDQFIVKLDSNGQVLWNTFIRSQTGGYSGELALSPNGGVFIKGLGQGDVIGIPTGDAPFIAKYGSNGELEWSNLLDAVSIESYYGGAGIAHQIQADTEGNVYIAINSDKTWETPLRDHSGLDDVFLAKFDADGNLLWNTFIGGPGNDISYDLYISEEGAIYLAGESDAGWGTPILTFTGATDGFLAKLDSNGALLWNTFLGGSAGLDSINDITSDPEKNLYLLGYSDLPWGDPINSQEERYFISQIDSNGNYQWHSFIESPTTNGYIQEIRTGANESFYLYGASEEAFGVSLNDPVGDQDIFIAKLNLYGTKAAFRDPGTFVPDLTTHIPTPGEVSRKPEDILANLSLAAFLMLPFAIAVDVLSRMVSENEEGLSRFAPIVWIGNIQKKIASSTIARLNNQRIKEILRLTVVAAFYGLAFSLLDPTWDPISVPGILLFIYMMVAFGLVGLLDDILQWRVIRKWGAIGEFTARPTNVFLTLISTAVSRILSLVPGLMFGSPEALKVDEASLSSQQKHILMRISMFTYLGVGLLAWLPTEFMDAPPDTILGGLQATLLVIYAAALENTFVQLIGLTDGLGTRMRAWNKWVWVATLGIIAFWFLHTLLDPTGNFMKDLQKGNVPLFIEVTISFVAITVLLKFLQRFRKNKKQTPNSV